MEEEVIIRITREPSYSDVEWKEAWQQVEIKEEVSSSPTTNRFVKALTEDASLWKVAFKSFEYSSDTQWVCDAFNVHSYLKDFMLHEGVRDILPTPKIDLGKTLAANPLGIESCSPYHMIADLAGALAWGGAYSQSQIKGKEAIRLAEEVLLEWTNGNEFDFSESQLFRLSTEWSEWFYNVAWDCAWMIHLPKEQRVVFFLATDTD